jgi:hypothetical protein
MKKPGDFDPEEDSRHIHDLIRQGEGESLDFKFEISDARKIARTLVAFANTAGGTLLIGVKDNGAIAGIRSDEEYYMLDAAASMYCRPPILFSAKLHNIEGKMVLEASIPQSDDCLHAAPDKEGNYKVFIRKQDENLLPGGIYIRLHQLRKKEQGVTIGYTDRERFLLHYLLEHDHITVNQYKRKAGISKKMAENILIRFILLEVIAMDITEDGHIFRLCDEDRSREILNKEK